MLLSAGVCTLECALELVSERSGSSGNGPQAVLFPVAVRPPVLRFWFRFCSEVLFTKEFQVFL